MMLCAEQNTTEGLTAEKNREEKEIDHRDDRSLPQGDQEQQRADEIERHEDRQQTPPEARAAGAAGADTEPDREPPGELNPEDRPDKDVNGPVRHILQAKQAQPDHADEEMEPEQRFRQRAYFFHRGILRTAGRPLLAKTVLPLLTSTNAHALHQFDTAASNSCPFTELSE